MKPSIQPFESFLHLFSPRPDLSTRALGVMRSLATRIGDLHWPLVPACEVNPAEVLRIFNSVSESQALAVEILSLAAAREPREVLQDVIDPFDPRIDRTIEAPIERGMTETMLESFDLAFQKTFDLDKDDAEVGATIARMIMNIPGELVEWGMPSSLALGLGCVMAAAVGDASSLDRLEPAARLGLRVLFLGVKKSDPGTLVVLAA